MSELRLELAGEPTWSGLMGRPSLADRAESYRQRFPQCPNAVWVAGDKGQWLYGVWQMGQYWKNATRYYGAYPHSFLERTHALFPEIEQCDVLHAFSGSLPKGDYTRLDINPSCEPDIVGSVYDLAALTDRTFRLVIADPSYSAADAKRYDTPSINRGKATTAIASVVPAGGHLVWLDTAWPMYRKALWHYYGAIEIRRSTNQRLRGVSLFERTSTP